MKNFMYLYRFEYRLLQAILFVLGFAAASIGALVFITGVRAIHATELLFNFAARETIALEPATISPTMDNELRFYAVFWMSYGMLLLWAARHLREQMRLVPVLMGMFFLGGMGRAFSHVFVGAPHPAFIVLMIIELVAPVVVMMLYARGRSSARNEVGLAP